MINFEILENDDITDDNKMILVSKIKELSKR